MVLIHPILSTRALTRAEELAIACVRDETTENYRALWAKCRHECEGYTTAENVTFNLNWAHTFEKYVTGRS